jgi:hypothetical protein
MTVADTLPDTSMINSNPDSDVDELDEEILRVRAESMIFSNTIPVEQPSDMAQSKHSLNASLFLQQHF